MALPSRLFCQCIFLAIYDSNDSNHNELKNLLPTL